MLMLTLATYWAGLGGPYFLDDLPILAPVDQWHAGLQSWQIALAPNVDSFVDSRPVAMASFMLSSWLGGPGTFPLKLGNLLIHLLCGLLGWWLLRGLFRADARAAPRADVYAAIAAGIWLLHPLHVSTVLYAVQRMAQLATLFTLSAIVVYVIARQQLIQGRLWSSAINLFVLFPLLLALGILSKQNAAIAPILCLVLELAYFQRSASQPRSVLPLFFGVFGALPALAASALLLFSPERLLSRYAEWDFTLVQRLLTQPRALLDYLGMWFLPRGPQMGLYTDAYPVSTSLLSPPGTLFAITSLVIASGLAITLRKHAPSVFAGWFFFLVAHAVESSILPLEMYYEHRNYLPAFGLLIAAFGLLALLRAEYGAHRLNTRKIGTTAAAVLIPVLAFATFSRVLVWQHEELIIAQGFERHPRSLRARLDLMSLAFRSHDYAMAGVLNAPLLRSDDPRERMAGSLLAVAIDCLSGSTSDEDHLQEAVANAQPKLTLPELRLVRTMFNLTEERSCSNVSNEMLGDAVSRLADKATDQGEDVPAKYSARSYASKLYVRANRWDKAEDQARIGWEGGQRLSHAALLARIYLINGEPDAAQPLVDILAKRISPHDYFAQAEVNSLKRMLATSPPNQDSHGPIPAR